MAIVVVAVMAAGLLLILLPLLAMAAMMGGPSPASDEEPLTILQRRYARGEIQPEEYERAREDLVRDGGRR